MPFQLPSKFHVAIVFGVVSASPFTTAAARPTTFDVTPITIQGSAQVYVTAINNSGVFVGVALVGNTLIGFVQNGGAVSQIQGSCGAATQCVGFPSDINDANAITGYVQGGKTGGFVWENGAFVAGDFFAMTYNQSAPMIGPFINEKGKVAFNSYAQGTEQAYAGDPSSPLPLGGFGLDAAGAYVTSLNNNGFVAGYGTQFPGGQFLHFVGRRHVFTDLFPYANPTPSYATLINSKNDIVLAMSSAFFIYKNGAPYTEVDLPSTAMNATVQAFTSSGRVAGTYVDSSTNTQAVFLYNGTTLSTFGSYPGADSLHVSMNTKHVLMVYDTQNHGALGASYRVQCKGPGC